MDNQINSNPQTNPVSSPHTSYKIFLLIVLGIVLFVISLAAAYSFGKTDMNSTQLVEEKQMITPTPQVIIATPTYYLPPGNKEYYSEKLSFSLGYPNSMTVEEQDKSVSFTLKGPTQKEQTEFYDGIKLVFTSARYDSPQTLREFIEKKFSYDIANNQVIEPLQEHTYDGHLGYSLRVKGLGEITYHYIATTGNKYLEIADISSQTNAKSASQILASLKILD